MLTRGDLHIHSTASDGDLSPSEIVSSAASRGIDTIALTDHNSTSGIAEAAMAGKYHGVSVIPAVELSTRYKGESIHLLGYFCNNGFSNSTFQEILKFVRTHRFKAAKSLLAAFTSVSAYEDNLSVTEGIGLLRTFGAAVVLAHPVRISNRNLTELLNLPFDGLESKYCSNNYYDTCFFTNAALTRFSFYSGGSDFHSYKNGHQVHCSIGNPCLNQNEIQVFLIKSGAIVLGCNTNSY